MATDRNNGDGDGDATTIGGAFFKSRQNKIELNLNTEYSKTI